MKKPIDTTHIRSLLNGLKKHRAWITGFEMGSGKMVPFGTDLRMLHTEIEALLTRIDKQK